MRSHLLSIIFILFISAILYPSSPAFSQNSRTTLKFVFPFGEKTNYAVCPTNKQTIDGCCNGQNDSVYAHDALTACCRLPNTVSTVGTKQRCCFPLSPVGQQRWGQTESSVCGGYCAPGSGVAYANGFSSCCPNCSEVRAFHSGPANVCGTCCSKIPENCGTAGVRVCESATGSAYCSVDPDKCQPATDWIIGSAGEGGYACCPNCTPGGSRYDHTASSCGSCCPQWYAGPSLCCSSGCGWITEITNGIASDTCCPTGKPNALSSVLTYGTKQFSISTCCPAGNSLYATVSKINYVSVANSINYVNFSTGCCPYAPVSVATGGTLCCSGQAYGVRLLSSVYSYSNKNANIAEHVYSVGCCTTANPALHTVTEGTICCPTGVDVQETKLKWNFWDEENTGITSYDVRCCTSSEKAFSVPEDTYCCSKDYSAYALRVHSVKNAKGIEQNSYSYGCCTAASSILASIPQGTLCCPTSQAAAYLTFENKLHTDKRYSASCCPAGQSAISFDLGTVCCSPGGAPFYTSAEVKLDVNDTEAAHYSYLAGCCPTGQSVYAYDDYYGYSDDSPPRFLLKHVTTGCCPTTDLFSLPNIGPGGKTLGTICCSAGSSPTAVKIGEFYKAGNTIEYTYGAYCCPAGYSVRPIGARGDTHCCWGPLVAEGHYGSIYYHTDGVTLTSFQNILDNTALVDPTGKTNHTSYEPNANVYCSTGLSGYFRITYRSRYDNSSRAEDRWNVGCCTETSPIAKTIQGGGWGTYCCPANKSASLIVSYTNNSRELWINPSCQ